MTGWLRRGAAALRTGAERADLWPAGALAWLVFIGWAPLLLVVASPTADDLAHLGVSIVTSGAFPANAIALAAGLVLLVMFLCVAAAMAEVAILRGLPIAGETASARRVVEPVLAIMLLGALPAAAALGLLSLAVASAAPGEFLSPDPSPVIARIAVLMLPFLAALWLAVLLGQVFGGHALRWAALAADDRNLAGVILAAVRELRRRPLGALGVATVAWLKDAAFVLASYALLRVLWAPIGAAMDAGLADGAPTILLLVGFVAIWLALLLAAGALHVAVSTWWALELGDAPPARSMAARQGPDRGGVRA